MTDASGPIEPLGRPGQPTLDRLAFERLSVAHRRALKLHCYRMMGSLNEADDLVQETFLKAWRARSRVRRARVASMLTPPNSVLAVGSLPCDPGFPGG